MHCAFKLNKAICLGSAHFFTYYSRTTKTLPDSSQVKPDVPDSQFGNFRMAQSISESIWSTLCKNNIFCLLLLWEGMAIIVESIIWLL